MSALAVGHRKGGILNASGLQLVDLFMWRHLVKDLARAELRRENARLALGALWWIADPLLQMVVYTIFVSVVFQRTIADYPIFVLAALMAWKAMAASVSTGSTAVTANERIIRQLPFPRIVLPVARLLAQLWRLSIALGVVVVLMVVLWPDRIAPTLVWLPVLALVEVVLLLPFVVLLSAATVFVRDLANLMRHVMRLGLFLSPVLYSADQLLERVSGPLAVLYQLNPVARLLEGYRSVTYYGTSPTATDLLLPLGVGLVLLAPALAWFGRVEPQFGKAL